MKHRVPWFQLLVVVALVLGVLPLGAALAQDSLSKQAEVPAGGEVIAEGLNGPMGVLVDPNGDIWAIDSGMGGDEPIQVINPETGELVDAALGNTARIVKISAADGTLTEVATVASVGIRRRRQRRQPPGPGGRHPLRHGRGLAVHARHRPAARPGHAGRGQRGRHHHRDRPVLAPRAGREPRRRHGRAIPQPILTG